MRAGGPDCGRGADDMNDSRRLESYVKYYQSIKCCLISAHACEMLRVMEARIQHYGRRASIFHFRPAIQLMRNGMKLPRI